MPELCDPLSYLPRAFQRQQVTCTFFQRNSGARIDDRIRGTLPFFAQIAVGTADDDQRWQIESPDVTRPVLSTAAFEPGEPRFPGCAMQVVQGDAVCRRRQRVANISVDEGSGCGVI